ncbi:MAG: hypothetical protein ACI9EF_001534 [Pseudohongiellaceae bacterium]|jgi:hypothetical protein
MSFRLVLILSAAIVALFLFSAHVLIDPEAPAASIVFDDASAAVLGRLETRYGSSFGSRDLQVAAADLRALLGEWEEREVSEGDVAVAWVDVKESWATFRERILKEGLLDRGDLLLDEMHGEATDAFLALRPLLKGIDC